MDLDLAVTHVLENYHNPDALRMCDLGQLAAAQRLVDAPHDSPLSSEQTVVAARVLIDHCLERLGQRLPDYRDLLDKRFRRSLPVAEVASQHHMSEATFFERRRKAIAALAAIVAEIEVVASGHRARLLRRIRFLPPPSYEQLVGVETDLAQIEEVLARYHLVPGLPLVISGLGGLGKTSLAREALVRWLQRDDPAIEQVLVVQVRATGYSLDQLLFRLGEQCGLPLVSLPSNDLRLRKMSDHLAQHPSLLLIDNVETPEGVAMSMELARALSNVAQVIITSRHEFESHRVLPLRLRELSRDQARQLLEVEAKRIGITPLTRQDMNRIFAQVGGHPLALKLIAGQVTRLPVEQVLAGIRRQSMLAEELMTGIYDRSWSLLSSTAREVMGGLILLPLEGATWEGLRLAVGVAGEPASDEVLVEAIDELTKLNLLQVSPGLPHVYSIHRLTYHYLERKAGWAQAG